MQEYNLFKSKIEENNATINVLKGINPETYAQLKKEYTIIEPESCFEENLFHLQNIQEKFYEYLNTIRTANGKTLMLFETFTMFYQSINNIMDFGPSICVIRNNMNQLFPNPSNCKIPDFEELTKLSNLEENAIYDMFYSNCIHIEGVEYVEYISSYSQQYPNIQTFNLVDVKDHPIVYNSPKNGFQNVHLKLHHFNFQEWKLSLLQEQEIQNTNLLLENTNKEKKENKYQIQLILSVFQTLGKELNLIIEQEKKLDYTYRPELLQILNQYWGHTSFRDLKFYEDPTKSKELVDINQGEIIEFIIQQTEENKDNQHDILITAPTGSGKSILFQIPSIYIGEKLNKVTIVISPLIALMQDQVENLAQQNYKKVGFINSNLTIGEKEEIINRVKHGDIHILYLAPETLLSNTISHFIGDRQLGLLVIDEAHLVTTWGRDFRPDYWYLGNAIRNMKKYNKFEFPVVALTATAIYDPFGKNDMVFETIDSLSMEPVKIFLGNVRRDNIDFNIRHIQTQNHNQEKVRIASKVIDKKIEENNKTIVYCPFPDHTRKIKINVTQNEGISIYTGKQTKAQKEEAYLNFKDNTTKVMIATKAFGMGIDIPDIQSVYHFAPSGHLADYVQEIGRLARDPNLRGIAEMDFHPRDLRFSRQLFGISAIQQFQVHQVMKKLNKIYKTKRSRNFLVSVEDFQYIFPDATDLEQKVKTTLLVLEKDLYQKYSYNSIIVRPKTITTSLYVEIKAEETHLAQFEQKYEKFLRYIPNTRIEKNGKKLFLLKLDKLWEKYEIQKSFAKFKYEFYQNINPIFGEHIQYTPLTKISYALNEEKGIIRKKIADFFTLINTTLSQLSGYFDKKKFINTLKSNIPQEKLSQYSEEFLEEIANHLIGIYAIKERNDTTEQEYRVHLLSSREKHGEPQYTKASKAYLKIKDQILNTYDCVFADTTTNNKTTYINTKSDKTIHRIKLAYLLEAFQLGTYEMISGEKPAIFIRLNDPLNIDYLSRTKYFNNIVDQIRKRHESSTRTIEHFLSTKMDNTARWNYIEDYFLGKLKEREEGEEE